MKTKILLLCLILFCLNGCSNKKMPEIEMVFVQGGTFIMGCTDEQAEIDAYLPPPPHIAELMMEQGGDCWDDEKPTHQVTVSDFYIGKYEVTQAQWKEVMGTTIQQQRDKANSEWLLFGEGDNYPMYYVSFDEVQEFIRRINAATKKQYRLPTEAEWEYASRGGNQSKSYKYSGSDMVYDVAWFEDDRENKTNPVGTKQPNELGIYDMSGNVWEWCNDWYGEYDDNNQTNPDGAISGTHRVIRGGSWDSGKKDARLSSRNSMLPDKRGLGVGLGIGVGVNVGEGLFYFEGNGGNVGFRLVLSPS